MEPMIVKSKEDIQSTVDTGRIISHDAGSHKNTILTLPQIIPPALSTPIMETWKQKMRCE